jgi:dienelactone hydrolase
MSQSLGFRVEERDFDGTLFRPASAPRAGALVFHGGGGPTAHDHQVAQRLAELGYAAYVPDLFGETFTDRAHGAAVVTGLCERPPVLRGRARAALSQLASTVADTRRFVVVGHCFGGLAALELARSGAEILAAASLHGGLQTREPATRGAVRARVLACTGAEDPFCPPEQRAAFEAEMAAAGVDWQHHVLGGARHGFSIAGVQTTAALAYHEPSALRSWRAVVGLFEEVLSSGSR